jgi:hypothetical protein
MDKIVESEEDETEMGEKVFNSVYPASSSAPIK